jgi:ribosomal protein S18 acetylase RimI-like enzyme
MHVSWRRAGADDIPRLVELYRPALAEQTELRDAWSFAEGLAEPVVTSFAEIIADEESFVAVGTIDDCVFGFLWAHVEDLLPQAAGERIGVIRLVFVEEPARGVGVGEEMLQAALEDMRRRGLSKFDAIVSPGHRLAKNFFEAAGFSARRITMYHRDGAEQ